MKYAIKEVLEEENVVAPFAGAWIEIVNGDSANYEVAVAPFAGAWIEIFRHNKRMEAVQCRSLRGSVD